MKLSRARTHVTALAVLALAVVLSVPGASWAGHTSTVARSKAPVIRREPSTQTALVRDRLAATLLLAILTRRAPTTSK